MDEVSEILRGFSIEIFILEAVAFRLCKFLTGAAVEFANDSHLFSLYQFTSVGSFRLIRRLIANFANSFCKCKA